MSLVDSAETVAGVAKQILIDKDMASKKRTKGKISFYLTDKPYMFKKIGAKFLGHKLETVKCIKG